MIELLQVIALLCQVNSSAAYKYNQSFTVKETDQYQLQCQQYYISCWENKLKERDVNTNWRNMPAGLLLNCIKDRKVK